MKTLVAPFLCLLLCSSASAQLPQLNSYPGAPAILFLDFDGQTVSNTSWNWNGPIYCGPSGLTNEGISEVFNRVAEDYRPFQINVTTDSTRFYSASPGKRMRIIFTSSHEWYGNAGGVSMIGSFTWGDDTPAFVFTALLGLNASRIAEAGSHEAGHTLGLYHQVVYDANCVQVAEYNPGVGSGQIGWAPIMGVGYYRNMTLWHNGPNFLGCNNAQDELQLITSQNGIGLRSDDHSGEFKRATGINISGNQFIEQGITETSDDIDLFKINIKKLGQVSLKVMPFSLGENNTGSNMDVAVKLYDRNESLIGVYNPEQYLDCVIDTFLERGQYYISVEGAGNQYSPDYASLGAYTLQGSLGSSDRNAETSPYTHKLPALEASSRFPGLLGNVVVNDLQVRSPGDFKYYITDMQGAVYGKGLLRAGINQLRPSRLGNGLYIIHYDNGNEHRSEKFMKQ